MTDFLGHKLCTFCSLLCAPISQLYKTCVSDRMDVYIAVDAGFTLRVVEYIWEIQEE